MGLVTTRVNRIFPDSQAVQIWNPLLQLISSIAATSSTESLPIVGEKSYQPKRPIYYQIPYIQPLTKNKVQYIWSL